MSDKVSTEKSRVTVTKQLGRKDEPGEEEVIEEDLAVHQFITTPAEVEVGVALTMNLGNFESAKLSVSLRLPCYKEEIEDAYTYAQSFVESRIDKERSLITASRKGKANSPL